MLLKPCKVKTERSKIHCYRSGFSILFSNLYIPSFATLPIIYRTLIPPSLKVSQTHQGFDNKLTAYSTCRSPSGTQLRSQRINFKLDCSTALYPTEEATSHTSKIKYHYLYFPNEEQETNSQNNQTQVTYKLYLLPPTALYTEWQWLPWLPF